MNILFAILFGLFSLTGNEELTDSKAQEILDELYESSGNYNFVKPTLKIIDTEKMVASYNGYDNVITVERKVLEICSTFGKKSSAALAFIIGHELAHSFQMTAEEKGFVSDFLAFDKHEHSNKKIERNADLYGLFNCYLAGYNVDNVLESLLDKIYLEYNLKGKVLSSYPPLYERQRSSKLVEMKMDTLVHLYEDASLLATCGLYEQSGINLEYILEFYQGKEIYNNTGVNFLLEALNLGDSNIDAYLYPVEIDLSSRLQKPLDGRGSKGLSPFDKIRRENLVRQGKRYFIESTKLDPNYLTGHINTMISLILLEEYDQAMDYYRVEKLGSLTRESSNALELDRIRICLALANAKSSKPESESKARRILESVSKKSNSAAAMAQYNLRVLNGNLDQTEKQQSCDCTLENISFKNVGRQLKKNKSKPLSLKRNLHYAYSEKATTYFSQYLSNDGAIQMQQINDPGIELGCGINTSKDVIEYCKNGKRLVIKRGTEYYLVQL